ncbi:MAG TPA: oligosaccharide flippase family protein [Ignavibacteriaceae bacterium]|nr:oligosaccharide flippase family protein [Ignavibacteriaceae bacterium]
MDKKLKTNILKGSAATSIGTISGMVFQFLTVMILARYVTKNDLGIYVLVVVIVNMLNLIAGLGVGLTMVNFIASKNKKEKQNILLPVLLIRTFGCLLFSIVFVLTGRYIVHFFDDTIYQYVWYILAIFILANYRDLFYQLLQALSYFKQYSIVNVASSAFRVIVIFLFLLISKLDIRNLLIIEILATLQPLIHQLFVIPFKKHLIVKPRLKTFKKVINFSIPLYLNNLITFINGQLNIFIIGAYLTPASVANYDIARKVPMALNKIFKSFIVVYFPNLAKLFSAGDKRTAVTIIDKSIGAFSVSTALLFLFSFLFRNELTLFLFSPRYAEVSLAFALLTLNFSISGLGSLMGYSFIPAGYPSVPTWINAVGSVISIGLSFLLVPIYGYMGAVYALLIMNTVLAFLYYNYLLKYGINPRLKSFLKPIILLSIIPISLLYNGKFSLIINGLLFITALILGWIISEELRSVTKHIFLYVKKINLRSKS